MSVFKVAVDTCSYVKASRAPPWSEVTASGSFPLQQVKKEVKHLQSWDNTF